MPPVEPPHRDRLIVVLEIGLVATLIIAPLPFGSVVPAGRTALELAALILLVIWSARAIVRPTELPPFAARLGMLGLLALGLVQALPLPSSFVAVAAPASSEIRRLAEPPPDVWEIETELLGVEPARFDPPSTLSVDPSATASALRTGAAFAVLLLVATTVASRRGARGIAMGLLVTAGFQALYGLMVLVSGHDRIWHVPKVHFLDSATGTFVNRNHFSGLLAMSLAAGLALILTHTVSSGRSPRRQTKWIDWLSPSGSRNLLRGLLLVIGVAGLLASFSRAGIAVGVVALVWTGLAVRRLRGVRGSVVAVLLLLAAASVPLLGLGAERLMARFGTVTEDIYDRGGRLTVWSDTLEIVGAFPVFGSGFGTFGEIYPQYRAPEVRKFYRHAHNDGLQALAEGGFVGAVLLTFMIVPVLYCVVGGLRGGKGTLGVGIAAGLAAVLLHSLVDFDFHIPSNAAVAAILAGTVIGLPWLDRG